MSGLNENWQRPTFPQIAVSSALVGLTSLFGMGRGEHHRKNHQKILKIFSLKKTTYLTKENTIVHGIEVYIK